MRKRMLGAVAIALALGAMTPIDAAMAAPKSDARVKAALDALKMPYEVSESGSFRVIYKREDGRDQLVVISASTEKYDKMEIREIWTIGYEAPGVLEPAVARRLLEASEGYKLGAWSVVKSDNGGVRAALSAKVNANLSKEDLASVIEAVGESGDDMELELTEKDAF